MVEHRNQDREVGGSKPTSPRVVSLSKTLYSPKLLVIPRKRWLCPGMTEKLLTGMFNLNANKQTLFFLQHFQLPLSLTMAHLVVKFMLAGLVRCLLSCKTKEPRVTLPWGMYFKRLAPAGRYLKIID